MGWWRQGLGWHLPMWPSSDIGSDYSIAPEDPNTPAAGLGSLPHQHVRGPKWKMRGQEEDFPPLPGLVHRFSWRFSTNAGKKMGMYMPSLVQVMRNFQFSNVISFLCLYICPESGHYWFGGCFPLTIVGTYINYSLGCLVLLTYFATWTLPKMISKVLLLPIALF